MKRFLADDPKNSIRLLFPNLDFSYSYPDTMTKQSNHKDFMKNTFDTDTYIPYKGLGSLIPHI